MAPRDIELHIFTNATRFAPDTATIESTYSSFLKTFGPVEKTSVWYDPKPNIKAGNEYRQNLEKLFGTVFTTTSLVDGYARALKESDARFLFMLEHDWNFLGERITHSLGEICHAMEREGLLHLRFNRLDNVSKEGDVGLVEAKSKQLTYCVTPQLSNNPHVIQRERYLEDAFQYLKISKRSGSKGIEEQLTLVQNLKGAIYGPKGHPPTIVHLDGAGREGGVIEKIRTPLGRLKGGLYRHIHKFRSSIR